MTGTASQHPRKSCGPQPPPFRFRSCPATSGRIPALPGTGAGNDADVQTEVRKPMSLSLVAAEIAAAICLSAYPVFTITGQKTTIISSPHCSDVAFKEGSNVEHSGTTRNPENTERVGSGTLPGMTPWAAVRSGSISPGPKYRISYNR